MIRLRLKQTKELEENVRKFCEHNLKNRKGLAEINLWCDKYLRDKAGKKYSFEDIIKATPEQIMELKQILDENYEVDKIMDELSQNNKDGDKRYYIIDNLFQKMKRDAKEILIQTLNVEVCPYCNRNYVYSAEGIHTCELDHFLPKSKYPIFAASFYNLIPVCSSCNRKKKDKMFKFYPHKPEKETDDIIKFSYHITGSEYLANRNAIEVDINVFDLEYEEQITILGLRELYKHHKDIVHEILLKKHTFSDTYLGCISKEFPSVFDSKKQVEELVYGTSLSKEDCGKRPLSKLTQDIVNELKGIT